MKRKCLAFGLLLTIFLIGLPVNRVQSQTRTPDPTKDGRLGDLNIRNFRMPPFLVWTHLTQRDIDQILPRGATAKPESSDRGQNRFLVTGITDLVGFGLDLGLKSTERNAGVPGIGKQGAVNPVPIDNRIKDLVSKLAEVVHNLVYAKKAPPDPRRPFPKGPVPDPQQIILERGSGFDPDRDPPSSEGGRWVRYCEPPNPCPRPVEPNPEDVPDCADEQAEVDRLLAKVDEWNNNVDTAQKHLAFLQGMEIASDSLDGAVFVIIIYAVMSCPIGWTAGVVAVAGGYIGFEGTKKLAADIPLSLALKLQKEQLEEMKRIRKVYLDTLNDAFNDLRNCRKRAAEAAGRNTAAFQKYFNVDLPAFYECLKQRRCGRRWVPK